MGVTGQARLLVGQPVRAPLPYGLFSVAQEPPDTDVHSRGGVRFEVEYCGPAGITTETCPATGFGPTKSPTDPTSERASNPFTTYTMPVCAPVGMYDQYDAMTRRILEWGDERAVEAEFWTGAAGTMPHLAENVAVT